MQCYVLRSYQVHIKYFLLGATLSVISKSLCLIMWKKEKLTATLIWRNFCEITVSVKLCHFNSVCHSVENREILWHFLTKNFVKVTFFSGKESKRPAKNPRNQCIAKELLRYCVFYTLQCVLIYKSISRNIFYVRMI